jgi:hypothetical protein
MIWYCFLRIYFYQDNSVLNIFLSCNLKFMWINFKSSFKIIKIKINNAICFFFLSQLLSINPGPRLFAEK